MFNHNAFKLKPEINLLFLCLVCSSIPDAAFSLFNLSPICLRHHDKDNLSLSQSKQEGYLHNYYNLVIYEKLFVRFCRNYCLRVKVINSLLSPLRGGGGGDYSLLWPIQEHAPDRVWFLASLS